MCSQKEILFALNENDDKRSQTADGVTTYPINYALKKYTERNW